MIEAVCTQCVLHSVNPRSCITWEPPALAHFCTHTQCKHAAHMSRCTRMPQQPQWALQLVQAWDGCLEWTVDVAYASCSTVDVSGVVRERALPRALQNCERQSSVLACPSKSYPTNLSSVLLSGALLRPSCARLSLTSTPSARCSSIRGPSSTANYMLGIRKNLRWHASNLLMACDSSCTEAGQLISDRLKTCGRIEPSPHSTYRPH